ncbi:hypothetical protein MD484_g7535, partial [Candolleomyces efflorescens]
MHVVPPWLHLWFLSVITSDNFQQIAPLVVLIGIPTLTFFAASTLKRIAVSGVGVIMSLGVSLRWLLPWSSSSGENGVETEMGRVKTKTKRRTSGSMSSPTSPGKERKKIGKGALASLSYLQPHIDAIHAKAEALDVPTPVVDALKDLFRDLNTPRSSYHSLRPLTIIQVLSSQTQGRTNSLFYSREHQDAQELFQVVSECIKNEIAAVDKEGARDRGFGAFAAGPLPPEATYDIGKSVFDGLTANRRSCVICGYTEAVMHFAFDNWQLTVPRLAAACRLEDCLEEYTRLEILKDCICRKCSMVATHTRLKRELATLTAEVTKPDSKPSSSKKKRLKEVKKMEGRVQAALDEGRIEDELKDVRMEKVVSSASTKQAMIARPPPVLALHLNRSIHYGHYASKNNCRVVFPEVLDLTAYTTSGSLSTIPTAAISTPPPNSNPTPASSSSSTSSARSSTKSRSTTPTPSLYRRKPKRLLVDEGGNGGEGVWGFENPVLVDPLYSFVDPEEDVESLKKKRTQEEDTLEEEDMEPQYTFSDTPPHPTPNTGWLRISDDSVRECGIETVLAEGSSSVFMLYYELVVHDRGGVYAGAPLNHTGNPSSSSGISGTSGGSGIGGSYARVGGASEETLKPQGAVVFALAISIFGILIGIVGIFVVVVVDTRTVFEREGKGTFGWERPFEEFNG